MTNILTSLNATYINELTQEQINGAMNSHLIIPQLILFFVFFYIILFSFLLFPIIKGKESKKKVAGYLFWTMILTIPLLIIFCLFINTEFQIINYFYNLIN